LTWNVAFALQLMQHPDWQILRGPPDFHAALMDMLWISELQADFKAWWALLHVALVYFWLAGTGEVGGAVGRSKVRGLRARKASRREEMLDVSA